MQSSHNSNVLNWQQLSITPDNRLATDMLYLSFSFVLLSQYPLLYKGAESSDISKLFHNLSHPTAFLVPLKIPIPIKTSSPLLNSWSLGNSSIQNHNALLVMCIFPVLYINQSLCYFQALPPGGSICLL